ncbi:MAG: hypothetical protein FD167_484 [bacterium]|nr:MAG: hypothetical protein FD167_484 [bacterium]
MINVEEKIQAIGIDKAKEWLPKTESLPSFSVSLYEDIAKKGFPSELSRQNPDVSYWLKEVQKLVFALYGQEVESSVVQEITEKVIIGTIASFIEHISEKTYNRRRTSKHVKNRIKTLWNPAITWQFLAYCQLEDYELAQERKLVGAVSPKDVKYLAGLPLTQKAMLKRYLKFLVQIGLANNTFYTLLAKSRLIYKYATDELEAFSIALYEKHCFISQRYKNPRKQKKVLIELITKRFGRLISVCSANGKETYFVGQEELQKDPIVLKLVEDFFKVMTPSLTICQTEKTSSLFQKAKESLTQTIRKLTGREPFDEFETDCLHRVICPHCYENLVTNAYFVKGKSMIEAPKARIATPLFNVDPQFFNGPVDGFLSSMPMNQSIDNIKIESKKDDTNQNKPLHVIIDGEVIAKLDTNQKRSVEFKVSEYARLLKVVDSTLPENPQIIASLIIPTLKQVSWFSSLIRRRQMYTKALIDGSEIEFVITSDPTHNVYYCKMHYLSPEVFEEQELVNFKLDGSISKRGGHLSFGLRWALLLVLAIGTGLITLGWFGYNRFIVNEAIELEVRNQVPSLLPPPAPDELLVAVPATGKQSNTSDKVKEGKTPLTKDNITRSVGENNLSVIAILPMLRIYVIMPQTNTEVEQVFYQTIKQLFASNDNFVLVKEQSQADIVLVWSIVQTGTKVSTEAALTTQKSNSFVWKGYNEGQVNTVPKQVFEQLLQDLAEAKQKINKIP